MKKKYKRRATFNEPFRGKIYNYRQGTKRALLIEILSGPGGATFDQCMAATGWTTKICQRNIRELHDLVGFGLSEDDSGHIRLIYS